MKNILFVVSTLCLGGVETYLARIIPVLFRNGYEIDVWVVNNRVNKELGLILSNYCRIKILSRFSTLGSFFIKKTKIEKEYDLIVATGGTSLLTAALNFQGISKSKIVVGVYSQREFNSRADIYRRKVEQNLLLELGESNVFFCTDGCREDHQSFFEGKVNFKHVSPLLINEQYVNNVDYSNSDCVNILSVGRFVEFKAYNLYMIEVVYKLISAGFRVKWVVVGDGPLRADMEKVIGKLKMAEYITLIGEVDYSELAKFYEKSHLYIGAGTTLVEASSYGLPSICTIDGLQEAKSTGFFFNRPGIGTSDLLKSDKLYDVYSMICEFCCLNKEEKEKMSILSFQSAKRYSVNNVSYEYEKIIKQSNFINLRVPVLFRLRDFFSLILSFVLNKNRKRYFG